MFQPLGERIIKALDRFVLSFSPAPFIEVTSTRISIKWIKTFFPMLLIKSHGGELIIDLDEAEELYHLLWCIYGKYDKKED